MKLKLKRVIFIVISFFIIFLSFGCGSKEGLNDKNILNEEIDSMKIIIDGVKYLVKLEDNETVNGLISLLPLELSMEELNGNEKYVYLDKSLVSNPVYYKRIEAGDVMLYGDDCLVIFYKSFDTSYKYTKIGHIDNLGNLGSGSVDIRIDK